MTEFTQRRPVIGLLILVLLNLALLSVQVRDDEGGLLIRSVGIMLFAPPATAVNFLLRNVSDGFDRYLWLFSVEEKNRELERENAELKVELQRLRGLEGMLGRSKEFERLQSQYSFEGLMANIVWRNTPLYSHRILLNAGSRHGVKKDAAVLAPEGVVGRVFVTTPFNAEIELLTDQNAAAGAVLLESRVQGIIQGTGTGRLLLNYVSSAEAVTDGALVCTSGTDRIYPKDLPIGTVVSSSIEGVYQRILVKPTVDFTRLEEVLVVLNDH